MGMQPGIQKIPWKNKKSMGIWELDEEVIDGRESPMKILKHIDFFS